MANTTYAYGTGQSLSNGWINRKIRIQVVDVYQYPWNWRLAKSIFQNQVGVKQYIKHSTAECYGQEVSCCVIDDNCFSVAIMPKMKDK